MHNLSERESRPLIKVDCASLPASIIESELFGHEKGAFTGAMSKRIGRFELADRGTIFLDEIGELPIELQPKLLRVLQDGEFERMGGTQSLRVNVRVIAATNRDLLKEIGRGNFREDLYYRLNVIPIHVPPLRERREDIPLLVDHFIRKFEGKFGKSISVIAKKDMSNIVNYSWPGNVRELENIIERVVILSQGNKINLSDFLTNPYNSAVPLRLSTLVEHERDHILKVLELTNWRVSGDNGAASLLGLKRTTLEARMKKLKIHRPKS